MELEFIIVRDFLIIRFVMDVVFRFGLMYSVKFEDYYIVKFYEGVKVMFVVRYKRFKDGFVIFFMLLDM